MQMAPQSPHSELWETGEQTSLKFSLKCSQAL